MGKLADQILPQLNHMQKNFLGLLFFNELSSNIVDDMVAQQLSMMSTTKLANVMENVDQEVSSRLWDAAQLKVHPADLTSCKQLHF